MNEKKDISRSIRMTKTVYDIVDRHEGEGFNQKFENMVIYIMKREQEVDKRIKEKEAELKSLEQQAAKSQKMLTDIDAIQYEVKNLLTHAAKSCKIFGVEREG